MQLARGRLHGAAWRQTDTLRDRLLDCPGVTRVVVSQEDGFMSLSNQRLCLVFAEFPSCHLSLCFFFLVAECKKEKLEILLKK